MKRLLLIATLTLVPLSAHAHGQAQLFIAIQFLLYCTLLVFALILAVPGRRILSFVAALFGYPAIFFVLGSALENSPKLEKEWEYAMWLIWALSVLALVFLRFRANRNDPE